MGPGGRGEGFDSVDVPAMTGQIPRFSLSIELPTLLHIEVFLSC